MGRNVARSEKKLEDMTKEEKRDFFRTKEELGVESQVNKLEIERTVTQITE